jgi:tetratricopeptide (TPR) repeat protein
VLRRNYGWADNDPDEATELERAARQAARLAKEDTTALYAGGFALAHIPGQLDAGIALIDRALALDPNLAAAWHLSGWTRIYRGEAEVAIAHMAQAMRLNPLDPLIFGMQNGTALAHFLAGRYDEAAHWAETAFKRHTSYSPAARAAAATHALAGRLEAAREFVTLMLQVDPDLRLADLQVFSPYRRPEDAVRYAEGLRRAGLPE